jgi:hypothetical protein
MLIGRQHDHTFVFGGVAEVVGVNRKHHFAAVNGLNRFCYSQGIGAIV